MGVLIDKGRVVVDTTAKVAGEEFFVGEATENGHDGGIGIGGRKSGADISGPEWLG